MIGISYKNIVKKIIYYVDYFNWPWNIFKFTIYTYFCNSNGYIYIYMCVKRDSLYEFEFGEYMDSRIYEGNSYTLIKVSNSLVT